ncbi:Mitochondrial import inner membrane translocase subunit tim22 [Orbilia oligospora]|uniref:Mitochondrial import inner membrane translocase subunit TIM22 n=1 Tax=Orbilia oligospora TaxID=2813651 RepID=A0A6G1M324_ORBOL|nr:Mitochondrial import inner membrane translocase subunit tim22 [Orbilia oligospora]KAF3220167.1 Mitochondrial import inner membrane translocase subunit tim22 [Orbilia oligospora]KAF3222642.1 Mitochondrial import inner membrane translocase subunit tim22 [Orbilia oligospora]KAF3243416.1 Mitochondrial import inner membrane translocase subunit tim22 [Orbilia oligospora]
MAFPGGGMPGMGPFGRPTGGGGGGAATPDFNSLSPEQQQMVMVKQMQAAMESCPVKTVISGGMGFALGGVFGLFMASMSYDTMYSTNTKLSDLPWRQQVRAGFKDMGSRSWSSAKGFGMVGALFAGTECVIESYRAKNDLVNPILAGCATGGILGASGGPTASAFGCAGFAAFSTAIEYYLRHG